MKIRHFYQLMAEIFLNTFLLIFITGLLLSGIFTLKDYWMKQTTHEHNPVSQRYHGLLKKVYPDLTEKEIDNLLTETWTRKFSYAPFIQYKETAFAGKYVNVDENGFRKTKNQGPWPPDPHFFNVYLFGGSTTFGYGVADNDTIASYLQNYLENLNLDRKPKIYNFGRASYYSSQERILFETLITKNNVPDMAIFIDGLNDFYRGYQTDEPWMTNNLADFMSHKFQKSKYLFKEIIRATPFYRLSLYLKRHFGFPKEYGTNLIREELEVDRPENKKLFNDFVIQRYASNKKMIEAIADAYNIKVGFVWQPVPSYDYDLKYHLFLRKGAFKYFESMKFGYPDVEAKSKEGFFGENFIWAANIQSNAKESLYVDSCHYTVGMSKLLAEFIGEKLSELKIINSG